MNTRGKTWHSSWIRSITSDKVLDVLVLLFVTRGVPTHIRSDNGPEFIAQAIRQHLSHTGTETLYIAPGSPWENGYAESFFSRLRDELLSMEEFADHEGGSLVREETTRGIQPP